MFAYKVISAITYISQVFGNTLSSVHAPIGEQDAPDVVVLGQSNRTPKVLSLEQPDFDFHILQHDLSYNQQSTCIWSANQTKQYCLFANPQFNRGKGLTFITTPQRAEFLLECIANASSHYEAILEPPFRTVGGGVKGRGLFTNHHISANSLIIQEPPIMLLDDNWTRDNVSEDAWHALLALAVEKLPTSTRRTFEELYGGSNETNKDSYRSKFTTNSYAIGGGPTEDWPGLNDESDLSMAVSHANMSKINHSCHSNVAAQWDWSVLAHRFYALRDIAAGEELTMGYFDAKMILEDRRQYIEENLGFKCGCNLCTAPSKFSEISDDRVNEILLLEEYLENRAIAPAEPTAMAELLVDLHEQEGLHLHLCKAYALAALEFNGAGHEYQARSWAYKSVQAGLLVSGSVGVEGYLEEMQELLDGARAHWSWRHRVH